jgi:hypothetical protein
MKLCAIYNVWHDWDWLKLSRENISPFVDGIIIVASESSNYGEWSPIPVTELNFDFYSPQFLLKRPQEIETDKRNYGLQKAIERGYTHFIMLDSDELYDPIEFRKAKDYINSKPNLQGLVCKSQVYVKSPTLTIGEDTTLVPFIHKLTPTIRHEFNRKYPFAWIDGKIRIDPTRSLNINSGVEMIDVTMHHYSWVRKDYARKIRNSTARPNIEKMNLAQKVLRLKEGDVFDLYPGKPLVRVPNKFGLPEFNAEVLE